MAADKEVSVIIPLYNRGPYVKRALDSVFRQTVQDFEVIIVDGHSADDGPSVVKDLEDPRITFVEQEGRGVSTARNQGVELAKSDFIAFLDADDEWSPNHLETLINLRRRFPEAGLYATAYRAIEPGPRITTPDLQAIPPSPWEGLIPNYIQAITYGDFPFITTSVGMPRKIFLEMGGFLPDVWWNEDIELWFRIIMRYPVAFSWDGIGLWHCDAENRLTGSLPYLERDARITRAMEALENPGTPEKYRLYLKEHIAKYEINRALWNIKAGQPGKARGILHECETTLFYRKKIALLMLSYVPAPVYKSGWKFVRFLKQRLQNRDYSHDPWLKE
jgi:glycosyltransferase involved in cell wall biosynthesis